MPFVSITRLRLRSPLYLLPFFIHTARSARQLVNESKFLGGKTLLDKGLTFWTMTLWNSEVDMRAYRNTDAHKKAMPKLQNWCNEASIVHWEQEGTGMPEWFDAHERMKSGGRLSKVKHPSADHIAMKIPQPRYPSPTERILKPKQKA